MPTLANPNKSETTSLVLQMVAEINDREVSPAEVRKTAAPGRKASVVIEIVVGLGVAAVWDAVKYAIHRVRERGLDEHDVIEIDGRTYRLADLDDQTGASGSGDGSPDRSDGDESDDNPPGTDR